MLFIKAAKDFLARLHVKFTLFKLTVKKTLLSIPFTSLKLLKDRISGSDVWNQNFFPNYGNQSVSPTTPNKPTVSRRLSNSKVDASRTSRFSFIRDNFWSLPSLLWSGLRDLLTYLLMIFKRGFDDGGLVIRGLAITFFFDAMLTDDEPLWEPIEWSLVQVWIMFVFAFAWIAENLITSRYGSYTGRDKRVWFSWYKTFWLIEGWYVLSLGAAALFVIVPFYHEVNYTLPLVVSWWNWYTRIFFFKFISIYSLVLYLAYYLQLNLGSFHWRKSLFIILLINMFLSYLLYTHFLMSFFAYFTDPNWYHKTRLTDYVQLSHEPNKWSWGNAKRDHFSYHKSSTVFWFKNDGPFAAAFLLFNIMFFLCLFALYIYWVVLFRRVYTTQEITYTYTTYCVSALRQFFYFFLLLYLLVMFSFAVQYWRLPIEYAWIANSSPIFATLQANICDYPAFLLSLIL